MGSVLAAVLAGGVAYGLYPNIKYCFLVIGASALLAIVFVQYLPQGDPLMGRGFQGKVAMDENGQMETLHGGERMDTMIEKKDVVSPKESPTASSYWEVFSDLKTCILCITGFFFQYVYPVQSIYFVHHNTIHPCLTTLHFFKSFANANVLLVLGELLGGEDDDGAPKRSAIPLIAGAIVTAQITMAVATWAGDRLTAIGIGRKPLFMAGLLSLPIRCALIIWLRNAGEGFLLSTQVLDGIGGGLLGLIHPYLVADITFGTGRFNVVSTSLYCCAPMEEK